ncbi:MAG: hypothetical protein JW776_01185 [Candidatus Lokiarchaeota archaeon]|nr:hypothetical protein [Candidatus Lokiarchaeota archaeon]
MKDGFKKIAAIGVLISPIFFVVLTTLAMFFFPGGYSIRDIVFPTTYYKFEMNFFSDLGMLTTETGLPNLTSSILFGFALTLMGLSFMFYSITLPSYFQKYTHQYRLAVAGSVFAVLSALGFVGIAFTPWDVLLTPHIFFVFFAFPISAFYSILLCIAVFIEESYPNVYGWLLIVFTVAMGGYLWFLFGGPDLSYFDGRVIQVLAQKAIVYIMIVMIPIQAVGSLYLLRKK